ncbi:MAG: GHKL domain-containing protein [Lachnospiraceae bacterium]|nr:GHKL domain-containing protein [Lachnospiraceae bacterium]
MAHAILYLLIFLIEGYIAFYYYDHILCRASSRPVSIPYILVYACLYAIFFANIVVLNDISFFALNYFLVLQVYACPLFTGLFFTLLLESMMLLTEFIPGILLGNTILKATDIALVPQTSRYIFIVCSKLLFFLVVLIVVRIFHHGHAQSSTNKSFWPLLSICTFTCCISVILIYVCCHNNLNRPSEYMLLFTSFVLIAISLFFAWLFDYNQTQQTLITNLKLESQRAEDAIQYSRLMEQQDEDQKILIHDIKNHLQAIHDLNISGQYREANQYIEQLTDTSALSRTYQPTNCQIFNLLIAKYSSICDTQSIHFTLDAKGTDLNFMRFQDVTAIFCNLMDNAIEAARGTDEAKIDLRLSDNAPHTHTVVTMVNSCQTPPVQTETNRYLSSKPDKIRHGFGTKSIENIIKHYGGNIEMYYSEEDKSFHTILLIQHDPLPTEIFYKKKKKGV